MAVSSLTRWAFAVLILGLAACQSYPLGMSEEEWNRLTVEQRLEARARQAELDRARAELRAEQVAARRQREALRAAEQRRRLERLYTEARYGDILECVIEGGIADFRPGWRPYQPVPFTLARGEAKYVTFEDHGRKKGRFWSQYAPDGREVTICYRNSGTRSRSCVTVSAMSRDFQSGIRRSVNIDDVFQNARLACAYRPGPGMPQTAIHQHDVEVRRVVHHHHHSRRPAAVRRLIEQHHWYVPALPPGQIKQGSGKESRPASRTPPRQHRPDDRVQRPTETEVPVAPDDAAQSYTPTAAPHDKPRRRVPPAHPRAREVAVPGSALQDEVPGVHPGRGKPGNGEAGRKADKHCDRGERRGQAKGHRNGQGAPTDCPD